MNNNEERFVNNCIIKRLQDRLWYELCGKKRKNGISRFCHNADDILKKDKIILSGDITECGINTYIKPDEQCCVIAYNDELDRLIGSFSEILKSVFGNGMPVIIIADEYAYIETEQCYGEPERYLLRL